MRSFTTGLTTCGLTLAACAMVLLARPSAASGCSGGASAGTVAGGFFGSDTGHCDGTDSTDVSGANATASPPTNKVDCGVNPTASSLPECQNLTTDCIAQAAAPPPGQTVSVIATYELLNGQMRLVNAACVARGPAVPGLSEADVRAEVVKLVPAAAIHSAPPGGKVLVQFETIFWVDTPTTRDLGTVTLLGHQVAITATAQSTTWAFGDDSSATSAGPGRP